MIKNEIEIFFFSWTNYLWFSYDIRSGPHRLEAQDVSLSRKKRGFEFPWGYFFVQNISTWNNMVEKGINYVLFVKYPYFQKLNPKQFFLVLLHILIFNM